MAEEMHLCLSDLLDQDPSSFEYFQGLPRSIQASARRADLRSFAELQEFAGRLRGRRDTEDVL